MATLPLDPSGAVRCRVARVVFGLAEIEQEYRRKPQGAGSPVANARRAYGLTVSEIAHA